VQYPIQDILAARNNFSTALSGLNASAFGSVSEAYYEALLYYGGKVIDYGDDAAPVMTGEAKRGGSENYKYLSPISSVCGANYIVVLSDGTPTDDDANTAVTVDTVSTDRFDALTGMPKNTCGLSPTFATDLDTTPSYDDNRGARDDASTVDNCLDDLSEWASSNDVAEDATLPAHTGDQLIFTHTIRLPPVPLEIPDGTLPPDARVMEEEYATAVADANALMVSTANKGEGKAYFAENETDLLKIFEDIVSVALKVNTTFSSPAVSVNAFNRSTHLDDLYFTLFKPHATENAWQGNLKKYKLKFSTNAATGVVTPFIADKDGNSAVDPDTGYFSDQSWSYWSAEMDKKAVNKGGAASMMNNVTGGRKVYTITGAMADGDTIDGVYVPAEGNLTATANKVEVSNTDLTDALLGSTDKASILTDASAAAIPYRTTLIDWAAGKDVFSDYGAINSTGDARLEMADPLHAEPALVQYGTKTNAPEETVPDLVAYVATNNGYLHAIDVEDGKEVFSFIPQDLLNKLPRVMENNGGNKTYGLDGSVVAWINDANGDGSISGDGEHIYLYFGMRRGGKNIYALDVTNRASPRLMWEIKGGIGDYAELGETWSTINVEKIKDGATEKTV
ncbi:MAG: hypothetical protein KAT90_15370, partial [Gammaproteobacteria bacterium]|nr:hypothetical protein [Gammaproteobacteria bacterium]